MKVWLVHADNGEEFEDYDHWVEQVFLTHDGAVRYLRSKGYAERGVTGRDSSCDGVLWSLKWGDRYLVEETFAWIEEMEVRE